jgi:leucyl aminopeptidase
MDFPVRTGSAATQKTECSVLPVFDDGRLRGATRQIDSASRGLIAQLVRSGDISGRPGATLLVHRTTGTAAHRWLLVGCGRFEDFNAKRYASALASALQTLKNSGPREATSYLGHELPSGVDSYYLARLTVETARAVLYRFDELKSKTEPKARLARFALAVADKGRVRDTRRGIAHGLAIARGADLARDLANRPPNVCTPTHLAKAARELARGNPRLTTEVLGEREIRKLRMGAFLSVTQGSAEPPQLIAIRYQGAADKSAPIVLCGKGITFDTGGISLKPPPKMDEMKFDMCGAASVIGVMAALGELKLPVNVVALVPACENMPGGKATRPGDIVRSMSGQTIEILNTDAEGRLVLCDVLTYAQQKFKPLCVLDVATLTGACVIALGSVYTGLFSNDDALAEALLRAGQRSLDPAWRLPFEDEYGDSLKSNFADFANSGTRDGGASVAANFLSRFVTGARWAHLDIAGVSWRANSNKGATGRPVALLVDFLLNADTSTS